VAGSWQAKALTSATMAGGKIGGATSAGSVLQSRKTFIEETFAPLAYLGSRELESFGDVFILPSIGSQQDEFGSHDISIR
jgi:hypothetical protein